MTPKYECDMCGACCHSTHVVVSKADVAREPKIAPFARPGVIQNYVANKGVRAELGVAAAISLLTAHLAPQAGRRTQWALTMWSDGPDSACPMLGDGGRCTVYETRPDACRAYEAGGEPCKQARQRRGLPPLTVADAAGFVN